jgi:hypothetical protein
MTYKEIMFLLEKGYSKEEIDNMDPEDEAPAPAAEPAAEPAPEPAKDPAPEPEKADVDLLTAIKELTAAVQANNRAAAEMGANIIDPQADAVNLMRGLGNIPNNK